MNVNLMDPVAASDAQLWQRSRDGDREAFERIVERYQSLICSLAYSTCGSFATSEDLAQDTFLSAWRQRNDLREPERLRSWLCGIVRNLAASAVRREIRRGGSLEPLETMEAQTSPEADPAANAVTREEESLLWRALAGMPENYRLPLVLFYREQQSVAEVSAGLELSEEVVRQRLSRGRLMLREEMTALVESALTRTRPAAAFTAGVLAALPFAPTPVVVVGAMTGKGAAAAGKGALASLGLGAIVGPIAGLFVSLLGSKAAAATARSPRERRFITCQAWLITIFCWFMSIGLVAALVLTDRLHDSGQLSSVSPLWVVLGILAWVTALVGAVFLWSSWMQRRALHIRAETGTDDAVSAKELGRTVHD